MFSVKLAFQTCCTQLQIQVNSSNQMNAMAAANMQLQQQLANAQQPVEVEDTEEVVTCGDNLSEPILKNTVRGAMLVSVITTSSVSSTSTGCCISCQQDKRISECYIHNQRIC